MAFGTGLKRGARATAIVAAAGLAGFVAAAWTPRSVAWSDSAKAEVSKGVPKLQVDIAALTMDTRPALDGMRVGGGTGAAVTAPGVVKSSQEATIASRITALVTAMPLQAGQSFNKGQLLASFDCAQMRAQLSAAKAQASAYQTTYNTNVELDQYKAIGVNEVTVSKANLAKANAESLVIKAGLSQCAIYAPFAGSVVETIAHANDVAQPGGALMKIQGANDLRVELIIPSKWLTWVKPGTPFTFTVEETGMALEGKVERLGAAVDPVSKTIRVMGTIAVTGQVLPGMSGSARFQQGN